MDEDEFQKLVSGTVGGIGAAGAIGVPIHKKYWDNPNFPEPGDIIEGMPPAFNIIDDNYYRVDDQGNPVEGLLDWYKHGVSGGDWRLREYENMTPFQRWSYNQGYRFAQDPIAEMIDWTVPFLTLLQDKIPGLGTLIPALSTAEDYKYDAPVEEIEIPEYTPLEFGPFKPATIDWPTRDDYMIADEAHQEAKPVFDYPEHLKPIKPMYWIGANHPSVIKYHELMPAYRAAKEAFIKEEQAWSEKYPDSTLYDMSTYFGRDEPEVDYMDKDYMYHIHHKLAAERSQERHEKQWQEEGILDPWHAKEIELKERNQREREAFNKRNAEEERRHREEYDKMMEDLMDTSFSTEGVGVPILPPMDTDFSMGDLEQGTFEQIRDMINDYFSEDAKTPAELMPLPEWLSVPSASTMPDPLNYVQ